MSPHPALGTLSRKQSFSRVRASRISTSKKRTAFFGFLGGGAWRHSPSRGDVATWAPSRSGPAPSMAPVPREAAGTPAAAASPAETRSGPEELLNITPPSPPRGDYWPCWPRRWPRRWPPRWPQEGQGHSAPSGDRGDRSTAQAGGKAGLSPPATVPRTPKVPEALSGKRVGMGLAGTQPRGWLSPPGHLWGDGTASLCAAATGVRHPGGDGDSTPARPR